MDFAAEFKRVLECFDETGIDVAVVGGWALAIHGVVRATVDIDLLIRPEQAELACDAATALGFAIHNPAMSLHDGAIVIKRLVRPQPDWNDGVLVLDLMFVTEALASVWGGRQLVESTVGRVPVVSLDGLTTLKKISGRPQDLADLEALANLASQASRDTEQTRANQPSRKADEGYSR